MPTQAQNNAAWIVPLQGQFETGEPIAIEILAEPEQGVSGLRKPYRFEIAASQGKLLGQELKAWAKRLQREGKVQEAYVESKRVTYGIRVSFFLLAYEPGYIPDGDIGVTADEWKAITSEGVEIAEKYLGPIVPYVELWKRNTKFQARWEGYVKFYEL